MKNTIVYADQASTSYPKPQIVIDEMVRYMTTIGSNIGRGGYDMAYEASSVVYNTRLLLCELFDYVESSHVIFTPNITTSLNMVIKGYLKPGDHVLVSQMEHNAVMRPLIQRQPEGITFTRIPCNALGELHIDQITDRIKPNTKAIIVTHASNVSGTILPLKEIGHIAREKGLTFIVDSAQTAGSIPISMKDMNIDVLAFTGHKGLLGPQGIGGLIIGDKVVHDMEPLITGGTGSDSDKEVTPSFMPDRFEAGTLNIPGIYGLYGAVRYLNQIGIEVIRTHDMRLTQAFIEGLNKIPEVTLIGTKDIRNRVAVISIQCNKMDESKLSHLLSIHGIMTRVGLHCAPNAHKTLGTFPTGTVRFSFAYENTLEEIAYILERMQYILQS